MMLLVMVVLLFVFCAEALSISKPPKLVNAIMANAKMDFLILLGSLRINIVSTFSGGRRDGI
jgi:hypothetical protein